MTYKALQDLVLARRFKEAQRADAKLWLNRRYWGIWTLEDWTFTEGEAFLSTTAGLKTLGSIPADIRIVNGLQRSDGEPLVYLPSTQFNQLYTGTSTTASAPSTNWTRVGSTFYVGPAADTTATDYKLIYRKAYTALVNDADVPAIPEGAHLGLVSGAQADLRRLDSDPMYLAFDADFNLTVDLLRENYLVDQRGDNQQWPAWP